MALFRTLPIPTNNLLPSLMVAVCLVLAPDVNFFINSRKQGLPCWRSLSFFLSLKADIQIILFLSLEAPYLPHALPSQTVFDFLSQWHNRLCNFILDIMDYFLAGEDQQQTKQPNNQAGG